MEEYFFQCPHCWENISMLVDISVPRQVYIEDCEVCCNPIELDIQTEDHMITLVDIRDIDQ